MNQEPENSLDSASPEQKLRSLTSALWTPIEVIRGLAEIISLNISSHRIEPEEILQVANGITEAAEKVKNLLNETVRSEGFYTPSNEISSTDILLALRNDLLKARQQKDMAALHSLVMVFGIIEEVASKKNTQGKLLGVLEEFGTAAREAIHGIPWKSTIPSEEEIISALNTK